ncbi:carotenoid ester lipase precursor [Dichomitus squalens]|uniref:Carboxylic ester hydrolase n=1 Tax=Dichomitus squalens TaxID=114155 RepID=A0A4Q9QEI7_9APHY|nr:carotenoid ester lipase precursor [Dichomitus squalens]TBU66179.1 carotenoid ester lipase precursor [Dichomitus squalens]
MLTYSFIVLATVYAAAIVAAPAPAAKPPSVRLDSGTFTGVSDGVSDAFLGIKFADAPRFSLPVPVGPYIDEEDAVDFGPACPQQGSTDVRSMVDDPAAGVLVSEWRYPIRAKLPPSEDCLNLNVWVPAGTNSTARLPVAVWIFGGGFETGSADTYDGGVIVKRSIELDEPVIYVSMNYRVSAFGFIAGEEVKAEGVGNIGLEDQRVAFKWIQKYITDFGGDPERVTIWGESAGAISVALHMLTNGGDPEGLFHGAFMQSGAPIPVGDIAKGQSEYDQLVQNTPCADIASPKTLECLRTLPFDVLKQAVDKSPGIISKQSLRLAWLPRVDGRFLTDTPQNLVLQGSVARIPHVSGNVNDEGTLFSIINSLTVWTDRGFQSYMRSNYVDGATDDDIGDLFDTLYPNDPSQGSPFDTGTNYSLPPQYKRLAAIQGDLVFQAPRRFFVEHTFDKQPTWSFLSKRTLTIGDSAFELGRFGAAHGSDLGNVYGPGDMTSYLIHFVNRGDPNGAGDGLIEWPTYDNQTRQQLTFVDDIDTPLNITRDDYRVDGFSKLTELSLRFPL